MIKIDLITGFLGSGKTTFIKKYAEFLISQGMKIGILENDFGAVNVDRMLLQELQGDRCDIETVAGACDEDCHKRRFKTKLIAMGMSGYDRVIVEPSGIYDTDEFFDTLHEDPLDKWYEIGSVITIVDAGVDMSLSSVSEYILASQLANAGKIVLSKADLVTEDQVAATVRYIGSLAERYCGKWIEDKIVAKNPEEYSYEDYYELSGGGYEKGDFVKQSDEEAEYRSLYYMNNHMTLKHLTDTVQRIFDDPDCGKVLRIKGYLEEEGCWYELNADKSSLNTSPAELGQDVLIVIGEELNQSAIDGYFKESEGIRPD